MSLPRPQNPRDPVEVNEKLRKRRERQDGDYRRERNTADADIGAISVFSNNQRRYLIYQSPITSDFSPVRRALA